MNEHPIRYAVLRDQRNWDGSISLTGLKSGTDGALRLVGLPGISVGAPIRLPVPYASSMSGIASGKDRVTYTAITNAEGKIIVSACGCDVYEVMSGPAHTTQETRFKTPRGLLIVGERLLVADSGNGRVVLLELPSFRLFGEWKAGLQQPACLAADSDGRVYVLDAGLKRVLRFNKHGQLDEGYNATLAAHTNSTAPVSLAVDSKDVLYISVTNTVLRFSANGAALGALSSPETTPFKPRALVARDARLYVADAESGFIFVFDTEKQSWLGKVESYRGPVAAMALDDLGTLLAKPGLDDTVYRLEADAACVSTGYLLAGPLDAGIEDVWERAWVEAVIPDGTDVKLNVAASNDRATLLNDLDWIDAPSLDVLLRTLPGDSAARFVWLRVTLNSHDGRSSPHLLQVQAATAAPSYLKYLPSIYRRDDTHGFLEKWLALFRSELGEWEQKLDELPRQFDTRTVAEADMGRLASWLALNLPARLDAPAQRQLLADAQTLYRRRGTPAGIREWVRRHVGATIHLFEAYRERRVWQLGEPESSRLGLDTALPAGTPDGLIVPGDTYADRSLSGLRGDYYSGTKFENLRHTRIDAEVKFEWKTGSPLEDIVPPLPPELLGADNFSIRWTGQVRPRFSENYIFRTRSDDGVRLWVNGRLIINDWTLHAPADNRGQIRLEAERWYPIVLEYFEQTGYAQMELRWLSPSQPLEIVPQQCLYPISDEHLEFEPEHQRGGKLLEVGHAVVGQSRPQPAEDFGAPLGDDFSHLFTVVVAAAQVPLASQRAALRDLLEAEKPAHTDFRLCLVEPRMRVGIQARLGIDSIVAGAGTPLRLGGAELGIDSYLGGKEGDSPARSPEVALG